MARWQWMAVFVLAGVELGVAALVLAPNVSADYRAYFITRSSDCWARPVSGGYQLGQPVSFLDDAAGVASDRHKVCGWVAPFSAGTWSWGNEAKLRFAFDVPAQGVLVSLVAEAFVGAGHLQQRVEVTVNGVRLEDLVFTPQSQGFRGILVPAEVAALDPSGVNLEFGFPDRYSARQMGTSDDDRQLGLLLKEMLISPLPK